MQRFPARCGRGKGAVRVRGREDGQGRGEDGGVVVESCKALRISIQSRTSASAGFEKERSISVPLRHLSPAEDKK